LYCPFLLVRFSFEGFFVFVIMVSPPLQTNTASRRSSPLCFQYSTVRLIPRLTSRYIPTIGTLYITASA